MAFKWQPSLHLVAIFDYIHWQFSIAFAGNFALQYADVNKKLIISYIIKMMGDPVYFDYLNKVNTRELAYSDNTPFPHKLIDLILEHPDKCAEILSQFDENTLKKLENYKCFDFHHGDSLLTYAIYKIKPSRQETVDQLIKDLIRTLNIKTTNSHGSNIFHKSFRNPNATLMIIQALIECLAPEIVLDLLTKRDTHGNSPIADALDIASKESGSTERFKIIIESIKIILYRFPQMLSVELNEDKNNLRDLLEKNNLNRFRQLIDFIEKGNSRRSSTENPYVTPPRKSGSAPSTSTSSRSAQRHQIPSPASQSPAKPRILAKSYPAIRPTEETIDWNEHWKKHWKEHYKKKYKEKVSKLNQQNTIDLQETRQEEHHVPVQDNTSTSPVHDENDDLPYPQPAVTPSIMEDSDTTVPSPSFDEIPSEATDARSFTNPGVAKSSADNKRKREELKEPLREAEKSDQNPSKVKKAKTKSNRSSLSIQSRENLPSFCLPSIRMFSYIKKCGKKRKVNEWSKEPNQLDEEYCKRIYEKSYGNPPKFNQGQWAECYVYLFLLNYYLRKYASPTIERSEFVPHRSLNSDALSVEGEKIRKGVEIQGQNEEKRGKKVYITWFNKNGSDKSNRDIDVRKETPTSKKDNYLEVKSHLNKTDEHSMTKSQVMLMLTVSSLTQTNEKYRILQVNNAGQENVSIEIKESPYQNMEEVAESAVSFKLNFS